MRLLAGEAEKVMKKALVGAMLLVVVGGVRAQDQAAGTTNAAAAFSSTSAAQARLVALNTNALDNATPATVAEASGAEPAAPAPEPTPTPRYIFGDRDDYRWQLGVGFEYFRFDSNQWNANMLGVNTTLTYYTNSWFGVEGDLVTGFSPNAVESNNHAKILGYLGGFRIGGRRQRWEPWGHALVGGSHLQPQTAGGSRNALMAIAGGGVDYRIHARLSFRAEFDYVYTGYFSQTQNNFQTVGGVVLHF